MARSPGKIFVREIARCYWLATLLLGWFPAIATAQNQPESAPNVAQQAANDTPTPFLRHCNLALQRAKESLHTQNYIDAHFLYLSMSALCDHDIDWQFIDSIALTRLDEYQRAHQLLKTLTLTRTGMTQARARVLSAWVLVKGGFDYRDATPQLTPQETARIGVFAHLKQYEEPGPALHDLSPKLRTDVLRIVAKMEKNRTKIPWLAGTMSAVLPGSGQAYLGSWEGAAISLVLNGLFITATAELISNELYFAAGTTGIAGSIFYVGNILNAVDLAQRYNEGASAEERAALERLLIPEANPL